MPSRWLAALVALPLAGPVCAQSVATEWDTRGVIDQMLASLARLKPVAAEMNPRDWVNRGAPEAYLAQHQQLEKELAYLGDAAAVFSRQPEKLSAGLDTLFRLQLAQSRLNSLVEGVRAYQNPKLADLIQSLVGDVQVASDRLRPILLDLAQVKEQEFAIADREAQRCRQALSKQPVTPRKKPDPAKPEPPK